MLVCIECGARTSDFEHGWAAIPVDDPDEGGPPEVVVYCSSCFTREFGGLRIWLGGQAPPDAAA